MNWKRFIAECQEIKAWLDARPDADAAQGLAKILALILSGRTGVESIAGAALSGLSPAAALGGGQPESRIEAPDNIHEIIARWVHTVPKDPWVLGEVYEQLASRRRSRGVFYTDLAIIDFIMVHTVEKADVVADPYVKVLDPACGCGFFLLRAYDVLRAKFERDRAAVAAAHPEIDLSDDGIHRHIISRNLWGADIDAAAAEICRAGLLLKRPMAGDGPEPNILACDSLRRPCGDCGDRDRRFWMARYDYVVGNPPYLSFGFRGAGRLDPDYETYLRQAFSASAEYKLSYYVLFMERGVELLTEGGRLGFIVPDSFLLGRYYSKIRRFILENTAIELFAHIMQPVFKAAVGMSTICILTRESDSRRRAGQLVTVCQVEAKDELKPGLEGCRYEQSYFSSLPHNRFRLFSDLTVKKLIDKIDDNGKPLGNFVSGHSGIRSMSRQNDIVSGAPRGDTWRQGLVSGGQVSRYGLVYEGHWLNIDPGLLYKGGWDEKLVRQRKILVRQTGYTLTACIDDNGYYHLNNIHSFISRNGPLNLDYILLLLNSRLLSFYYHAVTMEYGRTMAQTDIDTLELLPVSIHAGAVGRAPELVRIMTCLAKRRLDGEQGITAKIAAVDDLINQLVYQAYRLTGDEIRCVEQYEARLTVRGGRGRGAGKK